MNRQELLKDFSGRLLQIRESLRVSKKKMANYLATEQNNYSRYEKARSFPNFLGLYAISRRIGISLDWLVCGTGPMYSKENEPGAAPEPVEKNVKSGGPGKAEMPPVRAGETGKPADEIETLVEYMERIPYLRHEMLVSFYKFLDEHKELVDSSLPPRR